MNAHNLAMVALTARMQHEFNYDDEEWAKRGMPRLNIDPVAWNSAGSSTSAPSLFRNIIIGIGGKMDGFMMRSSFGIAVSSEIMAILAVSTDLKDMRERMGKMVVAKARRANLLPPETWK